MRVRVLGGSGMLGGMLCRVLSKDPEINLTATVRNKAAQERLTALDIPTTLFDAARDNTRSVVSDTDYVINAIGKINRYIPEKDGVVSIDAAMAAVQCNVVLPYNLAIAAEHVGSKVLQIATDCVYKGVDGKYTETSCIDTDSVYGSTKHMGEVVHPCVRHLRCSIIGPEFGRATCLMEWLLAHPEGASVKGYQDHIWNGVTTYNFSKICGGIVKGHIVLPPIQHVVPSDCVNKYQLLKIIAESYGRTDLNIEPSFGGTLVDRTLDTNNLDVNKDIWAIAGYADIPSIQDMVKEMVNGI